MRIGLIIVGLIIAAAGIAAVMGKLSFKSHEQDAKIGDLSIGHDKTEGVPQWLGIAGIVIGGVLVVGGALKKD